MFARTVNSVLGLAMAIGAILTLCLQPKLEFSKLEVKRLESTFGSAEIPDPDKFYIRRIPTEDPFIFVWRVFVPQNSQICLQYEMVTGHTSGQPRPSRLQRHGDMILRLEIRQDPWGCIRTEFTHTNRGLPRGLCRIENGLEAFFENIDRHSLSVAGEGVTEEFSRTEVVELIRMEAKQDLIAEIDLADRTGSGASQTLRRPTVIRLGFPEAFEKEEESGDTR